MLTELQNFVQLKSRLFNKPLMMEPNQAEIAIGAISDRLNIASFANLKGSVLDQEQLKHGAHIFTLDNTRSDSKPYQVIDGVAFISVDGSLVAKNNTLNPYSGMTGYDGIKANLDLAFADAEVKRIVLDMDSSGGEVEGCFQLADFIYANRNTKHMTAMVAGVSASACYAIAAACNTIEITETSFVGSVGVVMAHTSKQGALEKAGIKVTLVTSGSHKADGNPFVDLPKEVLQNMQAQNDVIYDMFVGRVAKYRGMSKDAVINTQAAMFMGVLAIDNGLADKLISNIEFIQNLSHTSGLLTTTKLEAPIMEKDEHEKLLSAAKTESHALGVTAGQTSMKTRMSTIINCPEAKERKSMATNLAFNTEMSAEDAAITLGFAPVETTANAAVAPVETTANAPVAPVAPVVAPVAAAAPDAFAAHMASETVTPAGMDNAALLQEQPAATAESQKLQDEADIKSAMEAHGDVY